ncbi:superoxide dismutase [Actinomadura sp. NBRC 104412]|uniref:SMP-30/gluconolactonase/LRE family protein n=1 Tax=Actinomadura sp. NBRC 104412 TaxID=3032203 RepID=UPI002555DB83|nr:superoxide dismutase [Actinomadura sp. NBRC 104412]
MRSRLMLLALMAGLVVPVGGAAHASGGRLPDRIPLPNGFQPEGIATGHKTYAYLGSRVDGRIWRADLRTGKGKVFSPGPGTPSLGLKTGNGLLYVAGGTGGDARVIDLRTGRILKRHVLTTGTAFINDLVLTRSGAFVTDSANPVLYRLPLGVHGKATSVPLSGDWVQEAGTNANGIVQTPDRRSLLIVQSNTGRLFRVDPRTGHARLVDLGGESLQFGDGMLLVGSTLYVVQNRDNVIAVLKVARDGRKARVVERITDPDFDVPATVARFGGRLYLPNARFTTPPTPETPYDIVSVRP